ncbi:MAG: hypothetical protein ABJB34_02545 [Acidobacteriota bacterium]
MKTCPQCGKTYHDDYAFCLSDGAPLNPVQPISIHEEPTVVRASPVRKGPAKGTIVLFIVACFLTLALGAAIGVLYTFWPSKAGTDQAKVNELSPTPLAPRSVSEPKQTPEANTRPQRSPTPADAEKPKVDEPPTPPNDEPEAEGDPGQTRISFRRGRADETISGTISNTRSFVLYAKSGQNLTARVRSNNQCVSFDEGSPQITYPTSEGDNVVTVVNNCDARAKFSLSVNIH